MMNTGISEEALDVEANSKDIDFIYIRYTLDSPYMRNTDGGLWA